MSVAHSAAEVLDRHVVMELESIDRMYINVYVPILQRPAGCAHFWRMHRGKPVPSSKLMQSMTRRFVRGIERFCEDEKIPLIRFAKNERKEDVAAKHFATLERRLERAGLCEGVAVVGKAQEKTKVVRTENRTDSKGVPYPWLVHRSAMINHYYFYCIDEDFGPQTDRGRRSTRLCSPLRRPKGPRASCGDRRLPAAAIRIHQPAAAGEGRSASRSST